MKKFLTILSLAIIFAASIIVAAHSFNQLIPKTMILYAVPYIEVEYGWGEHPEGYKVFDNLEDCINTTKKNSEDGNYSDGSGYFGPVRPLHYYETPDEIPGPFPKFVDKIKFKSNPIRIES